MQALTETEVQRIAEKLELARRLSGMTQQQAAQKLGVAEKTVNRWENGYTSGFMPHLDKIAEVYGMSREELMADAQPSGATLERRIDELAEEVRLLRHLLLDPARLREEAEKLIEEEHGRDR